MKENKCGKNRLNCIVGLSFANEYSSIFRMVTLATEYVNGLCAFPERFRKFKYCPDCGKAISWKKLNKDKNW